MTLLSMGFRPFFLLALSYAAIVMPLWVTLLHGVEIEQWGGGVQWHAHELLYGVVAAVFGGFFLTAVPKWTGTRPVIGAPLAALAALWILGRLAIAFAPVLPGALVLAADVAFLPVLGVVIARPIISARRWRNIGFPILMWIMGAANVIAHLGAMGQPMPVTHALRIAVLSTIVVIALFGGRITPLFTKNVLKQPTRPADLRDKLALVFAWLTLPASVLPGVIYGPIALAAGVLSLSRLQGWQSRAAARRPLLGILHLGFLWLGLAYVLLGLSALLPAVFSPSVGLHALTAGALSTFLVAMLSRVSLGHTGRPLIATRSIMTAYICITAAGLIRTVLPVVSPRWLSMSWRLGGTLWALAFIALLIAVGPALIKPRADR